MPGIHMTLDIAKRSLLAQQAAFQVISHNIANVNTPGFSRQKIGLEPSDALPSSIGPMGSGVDIGEITRAFDRYLESQINRETEDLGKWGAMGETMEQIEAIFNESIGYGLNNAMNEFWNAWQDVANNPSGNTERLILIAKGEATALSLNDLYANLRGVQDDLDNRIRNFIGEINTIADQIAEINSVIPGAEIMGSKANDDRDTRADLINKLSGMININYYENPDGMVTILVGEGRLLVDGRISWGLQGEVNTDPGSKGFFDVKWDPGAGGNLVDITSDISGGKLAGWLELRDVTIEDYEDKLDILAREIIEEVNRLHSDGVGLSGYSSITAANAVNSSGDPLTATGLPFTPVTGSLTINIFDGNGTPAGTGTINITAGATTLTDVETAINGISHVSASIANGLLSVTADPGYTFTFLNDDSDTLLALGLNTFFTGDDASTIVVNSVVQNDINKIAAATSNDSPGDNTNALAIAGLKDKLLLEGGASSLGGYYSSLVSEIGLGAQKALSMANHQESMLQQLENRKSSISGVSLDEEMIDLMRYQNAYVSAAKLVSIVDEMLKALLDMA